ncbi:hypothetical protein NLJ89_g4411 [Agrocybe chaxingu]|uniref:DUF6593 domain-containing protein n=1 Tax=Agrocybe chaxingu TaxID=84603 RepID=A0A9W8K262_9AGAR|nr:hypothetical protein NLJ89_g4411 [Agrocybe chaxingu]
MMRRPLPLTFEDRTAQLTNTDFDELYDRLFFHVVRSPGSNTTRIYDMVIRASRHRSTLPLNRDPIIELEFSPNESLGTISFLKGPYQGSIHMGRYLRKTAFFGTSLSRKFMASDGREYKWGYRTYPGQEWTCTTMDNVLVAHYDLKNPNHRFYDVSGNNLIVYEPWAHIVSGDLQS